ncbi:putative cell division cycle protein 23-like isoform X2 [Apostichopus japonicus]|uniref:Cyclosome subunit 8 n=1 Tax=Stichopus japonicus TaxID=307972 RepID=A0A2G8L161_STIJA|nr:putative cell division cycle protein 23-like isoform X2 [Apostichopus japonicus]
MDEKEFTIDLSDMKRDLIDAFKQCTERGLMQSAKWFAELSFTLKKVKPSTCEDQNISGMQEEEIEDFDNFCMAKTYFDLREYDRAAFFTEKCTSPKVSFLHLYAKYMAGEKRKYDEMTDMMSPVHFKNFKNSSLKALRLELEARHNNNKLDGFGLYLYGVVLKKLELLKEAEPILLDSVHRHPLNWGTWKELSSLITDREKLNSIQLPNHWMRQFFYAHTCLELQLNEDALKLYTQLCDAGLSENTYIISQMAVAHDNLRAVDEAVEILAKLEKVDPYRLENMDTYSNLLYVKEMKAELSRLAHRVCEVDKYRVETCCVIGNYYSLRSEHEKAIVYFQRALKLNPNYLSAWTLMGHEYTEMKNTSAAIEAYRQAIEVNRRDFRAWYGLGQTYEILKMYFYCIYYFRQAQQLRPNDSRMLVALGESYEKLDKVVEAKKCYWRAYSVGDLEGIALVRLAKLYARFNEDDKAASFYSKFVEQMEVLGTADTEEQCQAYRFLARYHLKQQNFEFATSYAHKCCEYNETKEEGKAILKEIPNKRHSAGTPNVEERQNIEDLGSLTRPPLSSTSHGNGNTPRQHLSMMNLTFTP